MYVPYVLTNLGKIISMTYTVAYICSLIYSVASRATHFVISVPPQEFHFSLTPQLNMLNVNLGSRLQLNTSIYVHPYISMLPNDNLLPTIKYAPYTHASMHTQPYQS